MLRLICDKCGKEITNHGLSLKDDSKDMTISGGLCEECLNKKILDGLPRCFRPQKEGDPDA